MYYSLFHKQLINNQTDIIKFFPKNVFGIFSTVRRAHKIKSYPIDIHGCIGYWDINFNTLNKTILYNNLLRVSYDSVWKDTRNKYFKPIETEPETMLELDFMLNPIYSINKNNGIAATLTSSGGAYKSSRGYLNCQTSKPTKTQILVVKIKDDQPISLANFG